MFHPRVSRRHGRAVLLIYFALILAFSFQGISIVDIHVRHLASLCRIFGHKIKDHKRKVDANRFVSEIHQIWKNLLLLDSPNDHPQVKTNQRKKANFNCKLCISLLIEH